MENSLYKIKARASSLKNYNELGGRQAKYIKYYVHKFNINTDEFFRNCHTLDEQYDLLKHHVGSLNKIKKTEKYLEKMKDYKFQIDKLTIQKDI